MDAIATAADTRDQIAAYLAQHEHKSLLRFITCGSVDDGKSTLIGRLLHDCQQLFDDQLAALERDSVKHGTQGDAIDFALLVDGLSAEREQGITIDVAYRYFSTEQRKFIVADCPGHEQYTRNMATGASTADLAIVLIDARKGVLTQSRRHSYIIALLGVRQVILAVNKMDLVDYRQEIFDAIVTDYRQLAEHLGIAKVDCVPMSALTGDQVTRATHTMPWYSGRTLLQLLEQAEVTGSDAQAGFRLPVQWVNRPDSSFRGYAGTIASGVVTPGMAIATLPSGQQSTVARIVSADGDLERAGPGQAITLTLAEEIDISRGDVIVEARRPTEVSDQFAAHLLWMGDAPMLPGRQYWIKDATRTLGAQISEIKHKIDVNTQDHLPAKRLELNEVAFCNITVSAPIAFEAYADNRTLGAFILIDRQTHATVACGTLSFALRRASNIHRQLLSIDQAARAAIKGQTPRCLWFTGLSGSGKSTIANLADRRLHALGYHTYLLDGDNVRHGLNKDLGFTPEDRVENIRRVAEVAKLMTDAGLIVLVSFISPYRAERELARSLFPTGEFVEIFVDTPIEICEQRDVKGLYARARAGKLPNFTGIDAPYEAPEAPELRLQSALSSVEALADEVVEAAVERAR